MKFFIANAILFFLLTASITFFQVQENSSDKRVQYELSEIKDSTSIVFHKAYTLNYNEKYEQAEWAAYLLTKEMITKENARKNDFREDTLVATKSAKPSDYIRSGYDKGHLVPAADMGINKVIMSESFYMSNMSPQKPGFNRGIWKRLEEKVRQFAAENDSLFIATGPVLNEDTLESKQKIKFERIGKNKVAVPHLYYKVVAVYKHSGIHKGIGFLVANNPSNEDLEKFAVPIDSIEVITGINFFEKIPKAIQDKIEREQNLNEWFCGTEKKQKSAKVSRN